MMAVLFFILAALNVYAIYITLVREKALIAAHKELKLPRPTMLIVVGWGVRFLSALVAASLIYKAIKILGV